MTTAIDDWSKRQGGDEAHDEIDHDEVLESDVASDETDESGQGQAEAVAPHDDALALKKAKDMKIMKIAGGVLLVMGLGVGGLMAMGHAAPQGQQLQAQPAAELAPVVAQVAQVQAAPVAQAIEVTAPVAVVAPVAPIATEAPAPLGAAPSLASAAPSPAPIAAPPVAVASVSPVAQPVQMAAVAVPSVDSEAAKAASSMRADIDSLRSQMEAIRAESAGKDKVIAELRKQPAPIKHVAHPVVKKQTETIITEMRAPHDVTVATAKAAVAKVISEQKPVVIVDPQVVAETRQTMVSPPASAKGGKVRNEFTVYAVSNGRAWLTWGKDGMNYTVGVNSELPDYSKVTSIDDVRGIVFTSAGEVHPKPATK